MQATIDSFLKPKTATPTQNTQCAAPVKPDEPKAAAPQDAADEQDFIDYFYRVSKHPSFKGKKMTNRRVSVFGKPYYWADDVSFPITLLPRSFRTWCAQHKLTGFNSILVNVYENKKDNIGWHCDDVSKLSSGEVVSVSFALRPQDRGKELAVFEFRWPNKESDALSVKPETLLHGTVIRFDAKKHKKKRCEHRVANTIRPRINVTMRKLA